MAAEVKVEQRLEADGSLSDVVTTIDHGDFPGDRGMMCVMVRKTDGTFVVEQLVYLS
jgi:hypothetical protein